MKKLIYISAILFFSCSNGTQNTREESTNKTDIPVIISDSLKKPIQKKIVKTLPEPPRIEEKKGKHTLIIPEHIAKLVAAYDPNFKTWKTGDFVKSIDGDSHYYKCSDKQLRYAVIGEFNGDSITDVILMGHNKKRSLILGLISQHETYNIIQIEKYDLENPKATWIDNENNKGLSSCLNYCSPAEASTKMKFKFNNDAFLRGTYGKASSIFWYQQGNFKKAGFSD